MARARLALLALPLLGLGAWWLGTAVREPVPARDHLSRVMFADGSPASGARIIRYGSGFPWPPLDEVRADAEGRFALPREDKDLTEVAAVWTERHPGCVDDSLEIGRDEPRWFAHEYLKPGVEEVVLQLQKLSGVQGAVVDDRGAPRSGYVLVCAPHAPYQENWPGHFPVGSLGGEFDTAKFHQEGLEAGSWAVWAEDGARRSDPVVLELPGPHGPLRLVLPRDSTVRGRVVSTDGRPLRGKEIRRLEPRDREHLHSDYGELLAETDAAGNFELSIPGTEPAILSCGPARVRVAPIPGGVVDRIEFSLEEPVLDAELVVQVIAPRFVWLDGDDLGIGRPAETLADHYYRYLLPAGLHVLSPGYLPVDSYAESLPKTLSVVLSPGERREVVFDLKSDPKVRVHGLLEHAPQVGIYMLDPVSALGTIVLGERGSQTMAAPARGGRYEVLLDPGVYSVEGQGLVVPEDRDEFEFDLVLAGPPVFDIAGRVRGLSGTDTVDVGTGGGTYTEAGPDGAVVIRGVPPGPRTFVAWQGDLIGSCLIDVQGPDDHFEIQLGERGSFRIEVFRPDGRRARFPEVSLIAACGDGVLMHPQPRSRAGGVVLEPRARPGRFTLEVFDGTYAGSTEFVVEPGRRTEARVLLMPNANLHLTILGPRGFPLACNVEITAPSGRRIYAPWDEHAPSMGYTWGPLIPGEYQLEASHPVHGLVSRTTQLAPGADEELTLRIDG